MTSPVHLSGKADAYLQRLCLGIPNRRVGSEGNRAATDFIAGILTSFAFEVDLPKFDCIDWECEQARLTTGEQSFQVYASPYSLGCTVSAPLAVAATVEALEAQTLSDKIVLLRGDLAQQQLMPKNFPFYNPDEHKRIIKLLETQQPLAIVGATSRDTQMVGSQYPFPLIEDGDFDIPSVYMTEEEGERLAEFTGETVALESVARRIPATGCNVVAHKPGSGQRRVVLFAHADAKLGTPGATDNASGVAILLLLAELLVNYSGDLGVELVFLNGEDYFSNPGEQQYLARNSGKFENIVLGINVDGVGYRNGMTAYSLYDCSLDMTDSIRKVLSVHDRLCEGAPWYQGDHGLFLINARPALAFTSEHALEMMTQVTHTADDRPEIVDVDQLATTAIALRDLILHLDQVPV